MLTSSLNSIKIDTGDRTLPVFFHAVTCDAADKPLKRVALSRELFRKMPLTLADLENLAPHQCANRISGHGAAAFITARMWRASSSFAAKT